MGYEPGRRKTFPSALTVVALASLLATGIAAAQGASSETLEEVVVSGHYEFLSADTQGGKTLP